MPYYEYRCLSCGQLHLLKHSIHDTPLERCHSCNGMVRRIISASPVMFKGDGWTERGT